MKPPFRPTLLADVHIQPAPGTSGIADAVSMMQFEKVLYKMYLYSAQGILIRYRKKTLKSVFLSKSQAIAFGRILSFDTAEKWIQSRPDEIFGESPQKPDLKEDADTSESTFSRHSETGPATHLMSAQSYKGVIQNMGMTERTDRKGLKYQSFVLVLQDESGIQNEFLGVGLARLARDMKLRIGQKIRLFKETKEIDVTFDGKNTKRLRNEYGIEFQ